MNQLRIYSAGRNTLTGERECILADICAALGASSFRGGIIAAWFDLTYRRLRYGVRSVIIASPALQLLTWWARMLGIRVTWIVWPGEATVAFGMQWLHRLMARSATLACWYAATAARIAAAGYRAGAVEILPLPVAAHRFSQQLSLYDELADRSYQQGLSLCYVVGIITPLVHGCGVEQLLPAVQRLAELIPHLQVIIVGDGPEKKKLHWLSQMLGLQHRVRFVGPQEAPQRWFQFFSVTYLPVHALDGVGLRVAESLYAGVPVLATAAEGVADLLGERDLWLLPAAPTIDRLAAALADCERHVDRHKLMGSAAKTKALIAHDLDACIRRLRTIV